MITLSIVVPLFRYRDPHLQDLVRSIKNLGDRVASEVIFSITDSDTTSPDPKLLPSNSKVVIDRTLGAGIGINWNFGVSCASAPLVLVIGQDDFLVSGDDLVAAVGILDSNPGVAAVGSARQVHRETANDPCHPDYRRRVWGRRRCSRLELSVSDANRNLLLFGNIMGEPGAVVIRRASLLKIGGFSEKLRHVLDIDCWLRLCEVGLFVYASDLAWLGRRLHSESATQSNMDSGTAFFERMALFAGLGKGQMVDRAYYYPGILAFSLFTALRQRTGFRASASVGDFLRGIPLLPWFFLRRSFGPPCGSCV